MTRGSDSLSAVARDVHRGDQHGTAEEWQAVEDIARGLAPLPLAQAEGKRKLGRLDVSRRPYGDLVLGLRRCRELLDVALQHAPEPFCDLDRDAPPTVLDRRNKALAHPHGGCEFVLGHSRRDAGCTHFST